MGLGRQRRRRPLRAPVLHRRGRGSRRRAWFEGRRPAASGIGDRRDAGPDDPDHRQLRVGHELGVVRTPSPRWHWDCRWVRSLPSVRGTRCRCRPRAYGRRAASWRSGSTIWRWIREEAAPLLSRSGRRARRRGPRRARRRTEGWPVGLYLAALAAERRWLAGRAGAALTGDDRYIGDYLRSEILDRVSPRGGVLPDPHVDPRPDVRSALRRRPRRHGIGRVLERLERRNLLVVPLDRRREWYRYHQLFRELLMSELRRSEPEVVAELHRRAAAWCEANGLPETAIDHAQAAGDADRVAASCCSSPTPCGRVDAPTPSGAGWSGSRPTT